MPLDHSPVWRMDECQEFTKPLEQPQGAFSLPEDTESLEDEDQHIMKLAEYYGY